MQIFDFSPLDEHGEFPFAPPVPQGSTRFYHGTSTHFRDRIEREGFLLQYRVVTHEQHRLLSVYASYMPRLGSNGVWALGVPKRLNLAEKCNLAVQYASGLKGGVARDLHNDLVDLLAGSSIVRDQDRPLLERLRTDLSPILSAPGIVYAIDLGDTACARLHDRSGGLAHAPFNVLPECISFGVIVP